MRLAKLADLAVFRIEEKRDPPAGREHQRILRRNCRRADRTFRRFLIIRQRRIAKLFEPGGVEFDLTGRSPESAVLVFPVPERWLDEPFLLELVESDVETAGSELCIQHVLDRLGANGKLHPVCQRHEHFFVRFTLPDLHRLLLGEHDVSGDRGQAYQLIEFGP